MASMQIQGRRVYIETRYGEPCVKALRELGAHWDPETKRWWLGSGKADQVKALLEREGAAFNPRDPVDRAVRADQLEEAGQVDAAAEARKTPPPQDPDSIRLTGKGEYKGRTYYIGAQTKDGARVRLLTLPDADGKYLDFWADVKLVRILKTYTPREVWDGRRYSGRTRTEYTTLGSIARFVAKQKDPTTRRGCCTECGAWGPAGEACSECGGEGSYA